MSRIFIPCILAATVCLLCLSWGGAVQAQKNVATPDVPIARVGSTAVLRSENVQMQALDTAKLKGKVVLVYYWSTKCAVCLEKMQELRSNAAGWKGRPFVILAISRDEKRQDYEDYLAVAKQLNVPTAQLMFAHAKDLAIDNLFRPSQLPLSFIIDTSSVVQYVHAGRIPAEVWDQAAELIP